MDTDERRFLDLRLFVKLNTSVIVLADLLKLMNKKQNQEMLEALNESFRKSLQGRSEKDIDLIIDTMFEYRFGDLKTFPMSVFNKMCPVLPKDDDYAVYDDEIRKKIENIKNENL